MGAPNKTKNVEAIASRLTGNDTANHAVEDALELLAAADRAGYVLAPREPTQEMLNAGSTAGGETNPATYKIWRAMLAAAE
ncbi:MAG TPA: hypothetical protein VLN73_06890 [Alphaproteobacteria bacterium]|nr:hypothetical protein [Alphaproteobacteria bacterium]